MTGRAETFHSSGIVTLTTDFGLRDPFVGVMKGRLVAYHPSVRIIDLTHEILAHWPAEAGFWLARSFRYFAGGTVHVAVVDPGVGGSRDIALLEAEGHVFLAPDNGLLAPVVAAASVHRAARITTDALSRLGLDAPSATFHGRDVFAPLAALLASGLEFPSSISEPVDELIPGWVEEPTIAPDRIAGAVVTIDHFGNLLTNVDGTLLQSMPHAFVRVAGHDVPLRRTYSDVRPGEYLALVNSFGVLEVARAEMSAAAGLGLDRGAPVLVLRK